VDLIRQQLDRIQNQLAGLSLSQKMLAFALVAIAGMTLWYWTSRASQRDMVALFAQGTSPDDAARTTSALEAAGIPYEMRNGLVMVSPARSTEAWSTIAFSQALPGNSPQAFDTMLAGVTPWESTGVLKEKFNRAKGQMLGQMISRFPGVAAADVLISPDMRLGVQTRVAPSATVTITTRNRDGGDRRLAESAAYTVAGAVSGLAQSNVNVMIDGVVVPIRSREGGVGGGDAIIELKRAHERHVEDQIRNLFAFIPRLYVSVTADLNTKQVSETRKSVDPDQKVQIAEREMTETTETSSAEPAAEPGAVANIALAAIPSGSEGARSTMERTETSFKVDFGMTETRTQDAGGQGRVTGVSVRVPRSYFVQIWKARNPAAAEEPADDVLQPIIVSELANIQKEVVTISAVVDESAVSVGEYIDLMPMIAAEPTVMAATSAGVTTLASGYAKEIAIGVLAVVSLFMVSRMVKRSYPTPPPSVKPAEDHSKDLATPEEVVAGVATEGEAFLTGHELDPETLESRQMVQQISTLVKDDPETTATLIKRMINDR
jgi:flagellar biosynthesis/type III secretory pathway M-ring protein FliF/YscJ